MRRRTRRWPPCCCRRAGRPDDAEARIDARATRLVKAIRARVGGLGGVEDFLHAYALSTKEGLALMVLAEALLRVPDADTADRLIEDKLKAGDWAHHEARSTALLVSASAWTLGITARVIHPGETPEGIVEALVKRLGLPAVRAATRQAMRLLGSHFVLGQTIEEALARADAPRVSLLLRHAGRGRPHRRRRGALFRSLMPMRSTRSAGAGNAALPKRPGISVKLSALHPRYEPLARERVLELAPTARSGAAAKKPRAQLHHRRGGGRSAGTVAGRHRRRAARSFACGWDGFGLAVQAYQKRALRGDRLGRRAGRRTTAA